MSGSNHRNPDDIRFNTIDDAVYMEMKNDVSFIILDEINLWEHQSSFHQLREEQGSDGYLSSIR